MQVYAVVLLAVFAVHVVDGNVIQDLSHASAQVKALQVKVVAMTKSYKNLAVKYQELADKHLDLIKEKKKLCPCVAKPNCEAEIKDALEQQIDAINGMCEWFSMLNGGSNQIVISPQGPSAPGSQIYLPGPGPNPPSAGQYVIATTAGK